MKKAQIEIIGLVVIVIILTVGLLIAVLFLARPKTNTLEDQRQSIRAEAVMNAILQSNINFDDPERKMWRELSECITDCDGVRTDLDSILKEIFKNKNYYLIIEKENGGPLFDTITSVDIDSNNIKCPSINQVVANGPIIAPLTIGGKRLEYHLVICTTQF